MDSVFTAPRWLKNPHLQTIFAGRIRPQQSIELIYTPLELPDGDVLDLAMPQACQQLAADAPVILLLHGLEGSATSRYALGMMKACLSRGWRTIVMHQRGCGPTPNRLPRAYHALETNDLDVVIQHVSAQYTTARIALLGYSLGGAITLNWLADNSKDHAAICAATVVSVPLLLGEAAKRVNHGFSKIYQRDFLRGLMHKLEQRQNDFPELLVKLRDQRLKDFFTYDDLVTAPMHGFKDGQTYYQQASPKQRLKAIQTALLIIHAEDDPFLTSACIPTKADISATTELLVSKSGGHVGFVTGPPWQPEYWLETIIPEYFAAYFD